MVRTVIGGFIPLLFIAFRGDCSVRLSGVAILVAVGFIVRLYVSLTSTCFVSGVNCHTSTLVTRNYSTTKLVLLAVLPRLLPDTCTKVIVSIVVCTVNNNLLRILLDPVVRTYPAKGGRGTVDLLRSFCY